MLLRLAVLFTCLIVANVAHAQPTRCPVTNFRDVNYEHLRDQAKLIFISNISTSDYEDNRKKFKGDMIIPYINVPASTNIETAKSQVRQVQQALSIDSVKEQEQTVLHVSWSKLGVEAYKACLDADPLTLDATMTSFDDEEFFLSALWNPTDPTSEGTIQEARIIGGTIEKNPEGQKLKKGGSATIQVRRNRTAPLLVQIKINEVTRIFGLPRAPKKFVVGNAKMDERVDAPSDQRNPAVRSGNRCLSSADATPKWASGDITKAPYQQFIINTAQISRDHLTSPGSTMSDSSITSQDGDRICFSYLVNSGDTRNGASVVFETSVKMIKTVDQ